MQLLFPTTAEVTHIVRNRVQDPANFIGMNIFPEVGVYVDKILVDVIDFPTGMTTAHRLGSDPKIIKGLGQRRAEYRTGHFKETRRWDEEELLKARKEGTFSQRAGRDLVNLGAVQLDNRLEVRKEYLRWQTLANNGVIAINENGVDYTVDFGVPARNYVDLTDGVGSHVPWSDRVNAKPIDDILLWLQVYIGTGARPDTMYYDQIVAADLVTNAQVRDMLKQSTMVAQLNTGNLPQVLNMFIPQLKFVQYDQGYADDTGNFHFFMPDDRIAMTGVGSPGEKLGDFCSTISTHNGGLDNPQPGKFSLVEDKSQNDKNPYLDLTVGQYGLPRVFHPNWIFSAKVGAARTNSYNGTQGSL